MNKLTNIIALVLFSNTMRTYISNTLSVFYITEGLCIRYIHTSKLKIIVTSVLFSNIMGTYISNTWSVFYITEGLCIRYIHTKYLKIIVIVTMIKRRSQLSIIYIIKRDNYYME